MLRAVLDSMPDNISIKDLEGRYIFDNTSHCRFLGVTNTADVVGKTLFDFLPPVIAAKFRAEDLRVLRSGEAVFSLWTSQSTPPGTKSGCRLRRCPCAMTKAS
jgi:PAS domain S-box-containing protein